MASSVPTRLGSVVDEQNWLSLPEVAEAVDLPLRTVRGFLRDRVLVAQRRGPNNALAVPAAFLVEGETGKLEVLASLRGTNMLLADAGYDDEEIVAWLLRENDEFGAAPITALRAGRIHVVRRAAQVLGY